MTSLDLVALLNESGFCKDRALVPSGAPIGKAVVRLRATVTRNFNRGMATIFSRSAPRLVAGLLRFSLPLLSALVTWLAPQSASAQFFSITSPSTATASAGSYFFYQVTTSSPAVSYSMSGQPDSLFFDTVTGMLSGFAPSTPGSFFISVTAFDGMNTAFGSLTLTVGAGDTTPPVITLNGSNPMTVIKASAFTDPGASVTDNIDPPQTIYGIGSVNTAVVGSYTLNYSVTDAAGNSASTTRTVNVVNSTNANLSALLLGSGTLSPTFSSNTTNYTASVSNSVTSTTVRPTSTQTNATIQVRVNSGTFSNVASGAFSGALPLNAGSNPIDVRVIAQDGTTTKTYTVTVTRTVSANADLSALSLSSGTLSPAFAGATTNYTAGVPNAVATLSVTPTVSQSDAAVQVRVNGGTFSSVTSGNASAALALDVGSNTVDIRVTAQDGSTTKTYTVTVTRDEPSSNADLSSLSLSSGTLSPEFDPTNGHYNATVAGVVSTVSITAVPADPGAVIEFNFGGFVVGAGNTSGPLNLKIGSNPIDVLVTAQDGVTTRLYSMTLTRDDVPYNPAVNDRFSSGFPTNGISNTNPTFAGAGHDWSGVGWSISNPIYGFALLTPRHYAASQHVGFERALGSAGAIGFLGSNGVISVAAATNEFGEYAGGVTGSGAVVGGNFVPEFGTVVSRQFDTAVGLLATAPPRAAALPRYAILDLNPVSGTDPMRYRGLQVFTYGRNNTNGNSSPQVASTTISEASAGLSISSGGTYFTTGRTNAAQVVGGSSGSPAFHGWTNPNGARELALLGVNSMISPGETNIMSFFGTSAAISALNGITTQLGYAVRVVGNPTASWVGGPAEGGSNLFQAMNWSSNSLPDTFSLFDAASAAQRAIMVNTNGGFRGIYFRTTPGDNGFLFSGPNILAIGRGGIVNYDDSRQNFTAPLRVFENQVWDSGLGGLTLLSLEIGSPAIVNGQLKLLPCLLEVSGIDSTIVNGTVSGPGSLSVSSGDLVLNGSNSYTGTTWVNGGRLILNGSVASKNAIVNGGTLLLSGAGTMPEDATVDLAASGAALDVSGLSVGGVAIKSLKGVAGSSVNLGTNNLFVAGNNVATTFAGVISNTGGLTKLGTGTFTLSGANTYSGTTTVLGGLLAIAKSNVRTTISPTAIAVSFETPPVDGTYDLLPGPLEASSLATVTFAGLSANSTAVVTNSPNLKLTVASGPSSDANLGALSLSSGTLDPAFASGVTSYAAGVSNAVSSIIVTPTAAQADATIEVRINGGAFSPVVGGTASSALTLQVGANTIDIRVLAQDGSTTKTYVMTVTRAASANANLSAISLSLGTMSPAFDPATIAYTAVVGNSVSSLAITPTLAESSARAEVNGSLVSSGSASGAINLSDGLNTISVVVTAEDGTTTKTYVVGVTKVGTGTDTDGDGLNDAAEFGMSALGFDWQSPQPALVGALSSNIALGGYYTKTQFDGNRAVGVVEGRAEVTGNPALYGLYTSNSVMDLRMGGLMIQKQGSNAIVTFQPQTTTDLGITPFTNNGPPITNQILMPGGKGFIRIRANP